MSGWTNVPALYVRCLSALRLQTAARASLKALMKSGSSCRAVLRNRLQESVKYYRAETQSGKSQKHVSKFRALLFL